MGRRQISESYTFSDKRNLLRVAPLPPLGNHSKECNSSYSGCSGSAGSDVAASRAPEEEADAMAAAKKALRLITKRNELRAAVLFLEPKRQVRQQIELSSDLQTGFPA